MVIKPIVKEISMKPRDHCMEGLKEFEVSFQLAEMNTKDLKEVTKSECIGFWDISC